VCEFRESGWVGVGLGGVCVLVGGCGVVCWWGGVVGVCVWVWVCCVGVCVVCVCVKAFLNRQTTTYFHREICVPTYIHVAYRFSL